MFKFETPQKIYEIGGIRIGGQPGELPATLIGSIFYQGHKIVEDPKKGVFDRARAEELIVKQDELSDLTGNPCMLDVVCTSIEAAPWIFPACAAVDAMIASTAQIEHGVETLTDEHPLYKLFPGFVDKIDRARGA